MSTTRTFLDLPWAAGLGLAVVAALSSAGLLAASPEADDSLIGRWDFEQASMAEDSSGHGHHGRILGVRTTKGMHGAALRLDGKDDFVRIGDLGEHDQATVAFWMKGDDLGGQGWKGLVSSGAWRQGVMHISARQNRVHVVLHAGEDKDRYIVASEPLDDSKWYHVAVVADRGGDLRLLINGQEASRTDISKLGSPIRLEAQMIGNEGGGDKPRLLAGAFDDVRIYRRALDNDDVKALCPDTVPRRARDWRYVPNGLAIPDENYCDQPYIVITADGGWLCTMTTGPGQEGHKAQHVVCAYSADQGKTWGPLIDIEPHGPPEASWIVPIVTDFGRIYGFYTYNGDNVRTLNDKPIRADVIGWYAYRYSDDNGKTWSKRYRLPMRLTAADRGNDFLGKVQIFWGIDKPTVVDGDAMFAFTKLGKFMLNMGEGWFYRSDNLMSERDADKLHWELLPEGDHGVRNEAFGSVQEEHNFVELSDGTLYCVYRTSMGSPACSYSHDGGKSWTEPEWMTYSPGGRRLKTPRACPMVWKTKDGRYLFWFHNNPGRGTTAGPNRNPVWITGGLEKDGHIHWAEPELLLYDDVDKRGSSYPDLIEQDDKYWISETQKTVARVHQIDKSLLEGLWAQGTTKTVSKDGLLAEVDSPGEVKLPEALDLYTLDGLAIDVWLTLGDLKPEQVIASTRDDMGTGLTLVTAEDGTLALRLHDGARVVSWTTDPGLLEPGKRHHVVAAADALSGVVTFVVDGTLCDGGEARPTGWMRYSESLGDVSGTGVLRVGLANGGELHGLRLYGRYLRTSEAVAHYHAGPESEG